MIPIRNKRSGLQPYELTSIIEIDRDAAVTLQMSQRFESAESPSLPLLQSVYPSSCWAQQFHFLANQNQNLTHAPIGQKIQNPFITKLSSHSLTEAKTAIFICFLHVFLYLAVSTLRTLNNPFIWSKHPNILPDYADTLLIIHHRDYQP